MATQKPEHISVLDGIRGLAILLVLLCHFSYAMPEGTALGQHLKTLLGYGWVGVDLFFVLSGFLITRNLLAAKPLPHFFRNFYLRRTLRICPLYFFSLFILFVICPVISPQCVAELRPHQGWLWFYCANYGLAYNVPLENEYCSTTHFWSLAVEEHYYLLWPLFVFLLSGSRLVWACTLLLLSTLGARLMIPADMSQLAGNFMTQCRLDGLVLGSLLAVYEHRHSGLQRLRGSAFWATTVCMVFGFTLRNLAILQGLQIKFTLLALVFSALIVFVISSPNSALSTFFSSRAMRFFGKYSYAQYVIHYLFFNSLVLIYPWETMTNALHSSFASWLVFAAGCLCFTIIGSLISWHLLEKHFLSLKSRFSPNQPSA